MTFTAISLLLLLLGIGLPVAAGLLILGLSLSGIYSPFSLSSALGEVAWTSSSGSLLIAVPLFVLMGEILLRSGIANRMYAALARWISWLPGGLMHANIAACSIFAATSGSSAATAATIGTVATPQIKKYDYNEPLFLGTIAAGGTLGILIPPSVNLIIYGVITNTSIPKLYMAGFIPGFMLSGLFMLTVLIACLIKPGWGGEKIKTNWKERFVLLADLLPPLIIFLIVVGSIYAGWATPTESAALGVLAAIALCAAYRQLSMSMLLKAFEGTMRTTGMIMLIIVAAFFLNLVMASLGLVEKISDLVIGTGLAPLQVLLLIIAFYIILGCFMETLSLMIITLPIITPIIIRLNHDPIWFGILIMLLIETALITPPIGVNLFVVQTVREKGSVNDVMIGTLPFVITMFVMIGLLVAFPDIAMWLPHFFAG
ncbi:MAG: TRAP transporter large permease [Deltaproteobacteria bacterium]|jgi:C4-dicarboxylate transporter, DctM subunit|nr:TRAP transporter large permease [Deltaproteobacteria bacterium]MBT4640866.1 TRAP transporter large permease [Deltaproteobacteria bacterium]MBT6502387.1 TRAP transporter large permease [Deltaproteobacteria bacterium]MBT6612215.1 TRAP transporter large permease [Deltaproteobacteria bacterium]MBT7155886.1 TRAP transporter large permease [Deltaproteobacteria bacterium]